MIVTVRIMSMLRMRISKEHGEYDEDEVRMVNDLEYKVSN